MRPPLWLWISLVLVTLGGLVALRGTAGQTLAATVPVGALPDALAVDTRTAHAFVVNTGDDTVSMLDTRSRLVLRTIAVDAGPVAVAVDQRRSRALVTSQDGTVSVLDTHTGALVRRLPGLAALGGGLAVDDRTGHALVATSTSTVSLLDTQRGTVVRTITVDTAPCTCTTIVVVPQTGRAFVGGEFRSRLSVVDTRTGAVLRTVPVGAQVAAVSERTGRVFVAQPDGHVAVLDARSGAIRSLVPVAPVIINVVPDPRTGTVFVSAAGTVLLLDGRTGAVRHSVPVSAAPPLHDPTLVVDPHSGHAFVLNAPVLSPDGRPAPGTVSVLDGWTGRLVHTLVVGRTPVALAVDGRTGHLFVVNESAPEAGTRVDRWAWLPQIVRAWVLRVAPPPRPAKVGSVTILDTAHL